MAFVKATRRRQKIRLALQGPPGAGKTRKAIEIISYLAEAEGKPIAVVDTESGSASSYAGDPRDDGAILSFDVDEIRGNYRPTLVAAKIKEAADAGYGGIVFDSLTHFWNGPGGFLGMVDEEVARMKARGNKPDSFAAWKAISPIYDRMVQDILNAPIHVAVTLRAKTEYVKEEGENGKGGKVKKLGLAPEIRDNFQYEMQLEGMVSAEHVLVVGKTRVRLLESGMMFSKGPGENKRFADLYTKWSEEAPESTPVQVSTTQLNDEVAGDTWVKYQSQIDNATSVDALRAMLPGMKSSYPLMNEDQVEALRVAYTAKSNALKNGAPSANAD